MDEPKLIVVFHSPATGSYAKKAKDIAEVTNLIRDYCRDRRLHNSMGSEELIAKKFLNESKRTGNDRLPMISGMLDNGDRVIIVAFHPDYLQ